MLNQRVEMRFMLLIQMKMPRLKSASFSLDESVIVPGVN